MGSGWLVLAAVLMIFGGLMMLLEGIAAIANDDVSVTTRTYVFEFDLTGWGWIHPITGVVIVLAGAALLQGATWARVADVGWPAWPCSRASCGSPTRPPGPSS